MKFLKYLLLVVTFAGVPQSISASQPSVDDCEFAIADNSQKFIELMQEKQALHAVKPQPDLDSAEFLKNCALQQGSLVKNLLFTLLAEIDENLAYWREEKKRYAIAYFIGKSPRAWNNGKSQKQELEEYCTGLQTEQERLAIFLGQVGYLCDAIHIVDGAKVFDAMTDLAVELSKFLQQNKSNVVPVSVTTHADLLALMINNTKELDVHQIAFGERIKPFVKPPHFERYWLRYAGLSVVALAFCYYHAQIPDVATVKAFFNNSFNEFGKGPLQKIRDTILGSEAKNKERVDANKMIAIKAALAVPIDTDHSNFYNLVSAGVNQGNKQISESKILSSVVGQLENPYLDRAQKYQQRLKELCPDGLDYSDLFKDENNSPSYGVLLGAVTDKLNRFMGVCDQLAPEDRSFFELANVNVTKHLTTALGYLEFKGPSDTYQSNKLTLDLSSAAPIGLGLYGGYKVINSSYEKAREDSYKPLRYTLNQMERLLNSNAEGAARMAFKDQGLMIYNIHILKHQLSVIPREYRQRFEEDIAEIEEPQLSIAQKLNIVQRMYRMYDFLVPQRW